MSAPFGIGGGGQGDLAAEARKGSTVFSVRWKCAAEVRGVSSPPGIVVDGRGDLAAEARKGNAVFSPRTEEGNVSELSDRR